MAYPKRSVGETRVRVSAFVKHSCHVRAGVWVHGLVSLIDADAITPWRSQELTIRSVQDLEQFPLLDSFHWEILRLYPAPPFFFKVGCLSSSVQGLLASRNVFLMIDSSLSSARLMEIRPESERSETSARTCPLPSFRRPLGVSLECRPPRLSSEKLAPVATQTFESLCVFGDCTGTAVCAASLPLANLVGQRRLYTCL